MVTTSALSPAQIAARREGMTATDVAAIVGVHPHRRKIDVFLEKTGQAAPFVETDRSRWGHILEGPIRADYEQRHGVRVEVPGTLRHPTSAWRMATPDGLVYQRGQTTPDRGLEIKVHGRDAVFFGRLEYGDPGSDEVPPHELVQCAWGMHVTGLDRWDLVPFLDGAPAEYIIDRDEELLEVLADEAERFMVDHVRPGCEPEVDGSKSWNDWLKRKWTSNHPDLPEIDGDEPLMSLVDELRALRAAAVDVDTRIDVVAQRLKNAIGDGAGFQWREPGRKKPARLTWKFSAGHFKTAWKAVAVEQRNRAQLALSACSAAVNEVTVGAAIEALSEIAGGAAEAAHTTTVPGPRPFLAPRHWKTTKAEEKAATERDNDDD